MPTEPFDLRLFLGAVGEKFQRRKKHDGESLRQEQADEEWALYLPENANGPTIAEALIIAAEKSPEGIAWLRDWIEMMPPLRRQLLTLYGIVEVLGVAT